MLLRGSNRGLMFTNEDPLKVEEFFSSHAEPDYARTNGIATEDVVLPEGPLPQVTIKISIKSISQTNKIVHFSSNLETKNDKKYFYRFHSFRKLKRNE